MTVRELREALDGLLDDIEVFYSPSSTVFIKAKEVEVKFVHTQDSPEAEQNLSLYMVIK